MTIRPIGVCLLILTLLAIPSGSSVLAQPAPPPTQLGVVMLPPTGLASARSAGVRAVKILADWSAIEARRGEPAWGNLDRAVTAAHQDGLTPILVLAYTPRWASLGTGAEYLGLLQTASARLKAIEPGAGVVVVFRVVRDEIRIFAIRHRREVYTALSGRQTRVDTP